MKLELNATINKSMINDVELTKWKTTWMGWPAELYWIVLFVMCNCFEPRFWLNFHRSVFKPPGTDTTVTFTAARSFNRQCAELPESTCKFCMQVPTANKGTSISTWLSLSRVELVVNWMLLTECYLCVPLVDSLGINDDLKTKLRDVLISERLLTLGHMLGKGL